MLQVQEEVARMRHLEATREEAEKELAQARTRIIEAANAAIDEIVRASGLTYGEVLGIRTQDAPEIPAAKPARKRSGNGGDYPTYALIGDPACTYVRGPVPGWMKASMAACGMNPSNKADREAFRNLHMMVQV